MRTSISFRRRTTQMSHVRCLSRSVVALVLLGGTAWLLGRSPSRINVGYTSPKHPTDNLDQTRRIPVAYAPHRAVLFHQGRTDRSGAVIHDMLLAHAYAFQQNLSYGGACFNATVSLERLKEHERMIDAIGLGQVLRLSCPDDVSLTDSRLYTRFGTRLWTPAWLDYIRALQSGHTKPVISHEKSVVVHMRRGDVTLCDPQTKDRYLPNQYYLSLLKGYGDHNITIFSESRSTESWNAFILYNLQLDQSPALAWRAMMQANVLILSKSSFSIVPAIFNPHGVVVYTPFWVSPLPLWTVVDDDTARSALRANVRLTTQLCHD